MIAAWMAYSAAVALVLLAAGRAAEYVARAIGLPTRFVWMLGMIAALGLSGRALVRRVMPTHDEAAAGVVTEATSHVTTTIVETHASAATPRWIHLIRPTRLQSLRNRARRAIDVVPISASSLDVASVDRWNAALIALWLSTSFIGLLWLARAFVGLRRIARALPTEIVDGEVVLVSDQFGPALVGIVRARTVVPRWVCASEAPRPRRR